MDNHNNEYENNNLSGFDTAKKSDENEASDCDGYTLSPEGGHFDSDGTSSQQKPEEVTNTAEPASATPQNDSFIPNGNYGTGSGEYHYAYKKADEVVKPPKVKKEKPPKAMKPKKPHNVGIGSLIAVALITALVCSGCFLAFVGANGNNNLKKQAGGSSSQSATNITNTEKVVKIDGSIEELAETAANKAGSSVVGVQTTFAVQSFFSGQSTSTGSGSGVIYKSDGYIITNYHVIADALSAQNSTITVYLDNDTKNGYKASVINYNISCDLAVLKIDKTGLNAITIGDSKELKVGQYVVAIGSPGGLEFMGSTTFGIISGLNRQLSTTSGTMNLIQTDAAINPGNSGGALVNAKGELIGISSSKLVNESYEGMGFAIPVNTVKEICDNLIAHEGEGEPYTGISLSYNYTADVLKYYGYPEGAVVSSVDDKSPAANAGIKRGDIITKFGDTKVSDYSGYESALSEHFPGDKVKVTYYRSGKTSTVTLTVGSGN